jgi:hypothetical protein
MRHSQKRVRAMCWLLFLLCSMLSGMHCTWHTFTPYRDYVALSVISEILALSLVAWLDTVALFCKYIILGSTGKWQSVICKPVNYEFTDDKSNIKRENK